MDEVPILASPRLAGLPGVRHGFFTRQGGVSEGLYASLNVGRGSGDEAERVEENRRRALQRLGVGAGVLVTAYQVHSAKVVVAESAWFAAPPEADGVVTRATGLACGALAADCAPVLIADPEARVVAAVHAGWRGALAGVVEAAVWSMVGLGANAASMTAAVGPCIGPTSYEVGLEFLETFETADPANARFFAAGARPEKRLFDLPAYVLSRLRRAGVTDAEWTGHDTLADEARFFSNRRAAHRGEADYGRLLSAIMLEA
jgi:YfiH family protein